MDSLLSESKLPVELKDKIMSVFKKKRKIMSIKDKGPVSSSNLDSAKKSLNPSQIFVGRVIDGYKLKHSLMADEQSVKIIPIVGLEGIGKTTLARTLYNDPYVASYFDCRAWVTLTASYTVRDILLDLVACFRETDETMLEISEKYLAGKIRRRLSGRRYLIVIDDMWSTDLKAWDYIKKHFPEDNNRSRILVTAKEDSVATYVTAGSPHKIKLLDDITSWVLLHRKVFADGRYTPKLEEFGKKISMYCPGLPLAIHVVGGILLYLGKSQEAWMEVAESVRLCSNANNWDTVGNILSLSYTHLPNYLKPCFLYMAAFPEGREIQPSKLIKLWVAEGFLEPIPGMSFEEAAEEYLMELVRRGLLIVHKQEIRGKVKSYIMHDLIRDFCIKKAQEEKFHYDEIDIVKGTSSSPHIHHEDKLPSWFRESELPLLKVLDVLGIELEMLPEGVKNLFHLRYLAASITSYSTIAFSVSGLCDLQTLIFHKHQSEIDGSSAVRVQELFNLPQLRHITFKGEYPLFTLEDGVTVACQENLQTLSTVFIDESFPKILEAIPNLKKLGILICTSRIYSPIDLGNLKNLRKLEVLKFSAERWSHVNWPHLKFLDSLKKLTINDSSIPPWYLNEIGGLPILEVLKLQRCYFVNDVWMPTEGEFQNLRFLLLSRVSLREWRTEEKHYPKLERLVIIYCKDLEEIPGEIGDIPTLEKIELFGECKDSAVESVRRIHEKQLNKGNHTLQVYIHGRRGWLQDKEISLKSDSSSVVSIVEQGISLKGDSSSIASTVEYPVGKTSVWEITEKSSTRQEDMASIAKHPAWKTSVLEITEERSISLEDNDKDMTEIIEEDSISLKDMTEITEDSSVILEDKAEDIFMLPTEEDTVIQGLDENKAFSVTDSTQTDVEPETIASTRPVQTDDLQNSIDSSVVVEISLPGELYMSVDLTLHTMSTSSSKEMLNFGLDPKRDYYLFSGVVKPESNLRGQPSSGPTETCQASVGPLLDNRIMIRGGSESAEMLTLDEWHRAYVVTLTDKEHISLPEEPECPNLILLFLQRSIGIIDIPTNFFDQMPALCFVDLSGTGIRALPESLYKKTRLQVLLLKNCDCLDNLPSEIKDLKTLEVLNISGTELYELPDEVGQLSRLRDLQLSLYGPDDESEFAHLPRELMPTRILSELNELQALSIEVHPEDHRWKNVAAEITKDIVKLNKLTYLQYYFPTVESLECYTGKSQSWKEKRLRKFNFIVGDNVKRIVSRVPEEVETTYDNQECCLRYVNGNVAAEAVKTALEQATAFYLEHTCNIQSLTEFGIYNFKEIKFCIVRECPDIQFLIANNDRNENAFAKLRHLGIYYLWGLEQIWEDPVAPGNFQMLTSLTVDRCPKLCFIVSQSMVEFFSNLEELVVQDCESLKVIIQENDAGKYGGKVLPKFRKLVLRYLPELVTLGNGFSLSKDNIVNIRCCPKLNLKPQLKKLNQRKERTSSCIVI